VWASDLVIVPTATEFLSADGLGKVLRMMSILQHKKKWQGALLGILPTFYDEQTRESKATMESLQERFGGSLLPPIYRPPSCASARPTARASSRPISPAAPRPNTSRWFSWS
jgi:cellulose biosynthesis protein BcsQ